jgi:hypothetical protein
MAASYGYKSSVEAEQKAAELRERWRHVEIECAGEYVVWYCCSRDVFEAALERKLDLKCREALFD